MLTLSILKSSENLKLLIAHFDRYMPKFRLDILSKKSASSELLKLTISESNENDIILKLKTMHPLDPKISKPKVEESPINPEESREAESKCDKGDTQAQDMQVDTPNNEPDEEESEEEYVINKPYITPQKVQIDMGKVIQGNINFAFSLLMPYIFANQTDLEDDEDFENNLQDNEEEGDEEEVGYKSPESDRKVLTEKSKLIFVVTTYLFAKLLVIVETYLPTLVLQKIFLSSSLLIR